MPPTAPQHLSDYRLRNQAFFLWFNRLIFPFFYIGHWRKKTTVIQADEDARFKVRVNSSDILLIWEIWKFRIYEDALLSIKPGDVIVDIGAHIGVFSVWAAQKTRHGPVYAYEASGNNHQLLLENIRLNTAENIIPFHLAIFDPPGRLAFYQPGKNGALGSVLQDNSSAGEEVTAITLAEIMESNKLSQIDFLKLDAEGAEYAILLNAAPEVLQSIKMLVVEYHEFIGAPWKKEDIVNHLRSNGFVVKVEGGVLGQRFLFGTGVIKAWHAPYQKV